MAYLNKVTLIGNIGKDPETRISNTTGQKRVSFSLATTRKYKDSNGEQKEQTEWHNIVGWGKIADLVESLDLKKGTCLYLEGSIASRSWTDQTTQQKRSVTEINMYSFQILSSRNSTAQNPYSRTSAAPAQPEYAPMEDDDDLPF